MVLAMMMIMTMMSYSSWFHIRELLHKTSTIFFVYACKITGRDPGQPHGNPLGILVYISFHAISAVYLEETSAHSKMYECNNVNKTFWFSTLCDYDYDVLMTQFRLWCTFSKRKWRRFFLLFSALGSLSHSSRCWINERMKLFAFKFFFLLVAEVKFVWCWCCKQTQPWLVSTKKL